MKKRFLSMLLAVLMVLTLLPAAAFADGELSGKCGDNVTWKLEGDTLTISGTGPIYDYYVNTVPWKPYSDSVVKIVIEEGVTATGDMSFCNMSNVTSVSLPQSLETIERGSFQLCTSLAEIDIPAGVSYIGFHVFEGCTSLKAVVLLNNNTIIGTDSFSGCTALESIFYSGSLRQWKENVKINGGNTSSCGYAQAAIYFADESDPFTDIDCAFHDYIVAGYAADILNGYPDNTFRPSQRVTRAQFVTMLYNMCGKPIVSWVEPSWIFSDGDEISMSYVDAVIWGCENGIISGYSDGTFRPNERISRAQMATFAYRLLKELVGEDVISQYNTDSNFTDSGSIANSYREAVNVMSTLEVINGYEDGSFRPNATQRAAHRRR